MKKVRSQSPVASRPALPPATDHGPRTTDARRDPIASDALLALLTGAGLALTDRRLRQIADEGYFPPPVRGQYQREATLLGLARHYQESTKKKSGALAEEELRIIVAKRKLAEREADEATAAVEDVAAVENSRIALVMFVRGRLLGLPAKLSQRLAVCTTTAEINAELEKEIASILAALSGPAFRSRADRQPEDGAGEQPGA